MNETKSRCSLRFTSRTSFKIFSVNVLAVEMTVVLCRAMNSFDISRPEKPSVLAVRRLTVLSLSSNDLSFLDFENMFHDRRE